MHSTAAARPIRVLVVDDSAFIRQMFCQMLSSEPDIEVIDTASDPFEAREKIKRLNPDVLTLDIEMPKMDGLSFLEKIMTLRPMPVIMASSLTQKGAFQTLEALNIGAVDYVSKPISGQNTQTIGAMKSELVEKIRAAARANLAARGRINMQASGESLVADFRPSARTQDALIAIGASTGGVEALREVFLRMPATSPPVVVTQHMPEAFTRSFAARLDGLSPMRIKEAEHHERLRPGHAYIAPGGITHLKIRRLGADYVCKLEEGPTVSGHRPSVDVLFHSVAEAAGANAVGAILTGMGKDGADGLKAMREAGSYTVGQCQSSCVVYGMPQAAHKIGATQTELPVQDIPAALLGACEKKGVLS